MRCCGGASGTLDFPQMARELDGIDAPLVVFDGECLFCNAGMQFIVTRDPAAHFRFAPLHSDVGGQWARASNLPVNGRDATMLLVEGGRVYQRSEGALRIAKYLGRGPIERALFSTMATLGLLVPRRVRDAVYSVVARNRHRLGTRAAACWLPSEELSRRIAG